MFMLLSIHMLDLLGTIQNESIFTQLSQWITSPWVSLALVCILFVGFVYQLYSKSFNWAGILAILALLFIFLGYLAEGTISFITIMIFSIGVILVIIELFVVGAVLGIIGMVLIVFSLITMGDNLPLMLLSVCVALILSIIEWVILVKFFKKKISLFENVVLKDSTNTESGYTSHNDRSYLVGATALTLTDLRPAGLILFENERIDAVSEGSFINKDVKVEIIEVEGTRVVVREIQSN
ncbi:NfeD family protein [Staphylococcus agnetis]|uniref:Serine protease n=2 Tax=Staphylococcus agnetis TaxID=985762 RepID=A0ABX3Z6V9_9STAP|nr:serine protease [Staphylococcus agnetis]OSP23671.1 serine protease [Staphylococcus agnetis]OTW31745.1 serine protease [Staphylococcus agnetis]